MYEEKRNLSWTRYWWVFLLIFLVGMVVFVFPVIIDENKEENNKETEVGIGSSVNIEDKILKNKFGWLGGGSEDDGSIISDMGGAWVRPHPGAFLWDAMQKSYDGEIDFTQTDEQIKNYSKNNLGILVTLWPFADWDQENLLNASECMVSSEDEFLPKNDKKGRIDYLSQYRCNPNDWDTYSDWVKKIVERYDGDGVDDMPGLKMPIKYWEVMNEPDLSYKSTLPEDEAGSLNFYKQGPIEYGELLKKTYLAIKDADSEAQVLIAGAAGGDDKFIGFYEEMFDSVEGIEDYFDIGNVHCISNDRDTQDFNVAAYKKMLDNYKIDKPIWVTEAEAMYGDTEEENYQNTLTSTQNAIDLGVERIFFTQYDFQVKRFDMGMEGQKEKKEKEKEEDKDLSSSTELYKDLIENLR